MAHRLSLSSTQSHGQSYSFHPGLQPTLPVELYRQIVQYVVSQRDLCTLARVSRAFQAEAERVLYHSISLRHQSRHYGDANRSLPNHG